MIGGPYFVGNIYKTYRVKQCHRVGSPCVILSKYLVSKGSNRVTGKTLNTTQDVRRRSRCVDVSQLLSISSAKTSGVVSCADIIFCSGLMKKHVVNQKYFNSGQSCGRLTIHLQSPALELVSFCGTAKSLRF